MDISIRPKLAIGALWYAFQERPFTYGDGGRFTNDEWPEGNRVDLTGGDYFD